MSEKSRIQIRESRRAISTASARGTVPFSGSRIGAPKVQNSHSPAATPWDQTCCEFLALKGRHNFLDARYGAPSGLRIFPTDTQGVAAGLWLFCTVGAPNT